MLNFEDRVGPRLPESQRPTYPDVTVPDWFRDAKLGFFIHWGIYSVPAWAEQGGDPVPVEDAYAHHRYAEWYANTVRIPGSQARELHRERYGSGTTYEDLADLWEAERFDAAALIGQLRAAGGQYVIPTSKHHDGFCLWDTATTSFNAARRGPHRDLVQELHDATRAAGMRFGLYFSGAHDWHVADLPAIRSDRALFTLRRNDPDFSQYAARQLEELIARFTPDVLWNDIEWPDGGKGRQPYGVAELWRRYLSQVPEGVVNDRWGVPAHGFLTREYSHVDRVLETPWEATRGLGLSFGYNAAEDPADRLTAPEAVRLLVDVVGKNGNLLLNVGPRADGTLPPEQVEVLEELGYWLTVNGAAVYGTRPGPTVGAGIVCTVNDEFEFLHVLDPAVGEVELPSRYESEQLYWLGSEEVPPPGPRLEIPSSLRATPVAVAYRPTR